MFASQGQEAFIEGHLHAFGVFGGLPTVKILYDDLRSAVTPVVFGRTRTESDRWVQFRSHMGFEAWYCMPGNKGAHEKGGVEGEVGRFRRNHLVPVPSLNYSPSVRRAKRTACETSPSGLPSRSWASNSNPVSRSQAATLSGWRR